MERCEHCGYAWETVAREDISGRVDAGTAAIADMLARSPERAQERPSPQRWSATEYAAHVRDVLLNLRDRLVVGLVEDVPTFTAMYRDERVTMGLYRPDTPDADRPIAIPLRKMVTGPLSLTTAIVVEGWS